MTPTPGNVNLIIYIHEAVSGFFKSPIKFIKDRPFYSSLLSDLAYEWLRGCR